MKISGKHSNLRLKFEHPIVLNPEKKYKLGASHSLFSFDKQYSINIKTATDAGPHVLMFVKSAQDPIIHRMRKIKYIAKTATDTALIKTASITTKISARKFINAKTVIRLN